MFLGKFGFLNHDEIGPDDLFVPIFGAGCFGAPRELADVAFFGNLM